MLGKILEQVEKAGVYQYGLVEPSMIAYRQEIREICQGNSCRQYGTTWACPPAVGTIEQCKSRCMQYNAMLVFTGKFVLDGSFDYEGMIQGMNDFKQIARNLDTAVKPYLEDYFILSNESCNTCKTCTYPQEPCRFPEKLHHSIEGYGILVSELAAEAGISYNNGPDTITYFGALLFNDADTEMGGC